MLLEGVVSLSHMAAMGRFMGYETGPEERRGREGRCGIELGKDKTFTYETKGFDAIQTLQG